MNGSGTAIPHQMPGVTGLGALQAAGLRGRVAITGGSSDTSGDRLCFDRFTLLPVERLLLADDKPVHIGGRALDILIALTANAGTLMTKDDLLARVWPGMCVEDGNLRVHIVALRKALGDSDGRLIRTVAGRGYQFVAPVSQASKPSLLAPLSAEPARLPRSAAGRIIGRVGFIERVVAALPHQRLITIVGPGGIGKTLVAIACAEALAGSYRGGVDFVDLAPVTEQGSVAGALARVLGVAIGSIDPIRDLVRHLQDRQMLLVIDNCEHVVDAAAELVEAIVTGAPGVHVLATSREALRIAGESVRLLPPLPCAPDTPDLTAAEAITYPAVQLFVERATAAQQTFQIRDVDAPVVAEICRRLDGVALAIELAAAQVEAFGLAWLAAHLDERLSILNRGRRTAAARHQTLAALLDWSYDLLSVQERATLQRLAVFADAFTLDAAIAVSASDGIEDVEVAHAVGGLVSKSMATSDISGPITHYRLPETTRAYVYAKMKATTAFAGNQFAYRSGKSFPYGTDLSDRHGRA